MPQRKNTWKDSKTAKGRERGGSKGEAEEEEEQEEEEGEGEKQEEESGREGGTWREGRGNEEEGEEWGRKVVNVECMLCGVARLLRDNLLFVKRIALVL